MCLIFFSTIHWVKYKLKQQVRNSTRIHYVLSLFTLFHNLRINIDFVLCCIFSVVFIVIFLLIVYFIMDKYCIFHLYSNPFLDNPTAVGTHNYLAQSTGREISFKIHDDLYDSYYLVIVGCAIIISCINCMLYVVCMPILWNDSNSI